MLGREAEYLALLERARRAHLDRGQPRLLWCGKIRPTVKSVALFSVLVALLMAAPVSARTLLLGRSWQGRPIEAVEVGNPSGTRVLVVGCIHGNETAGIAITNALERLFPRDLDLWIVPDLNPDGVAADTRQNAHGVDLNRNFPWRWRPLAGVYESGPRPLSEREARIAHTLILRLHPHLTVWFHQYLDMVWASGGNRRIEKVFARFSSLPYHPMPQLAGSAISWQNNTLPGTTAFAAELPAGEPSTVRSPATCARCSRRHALRERRGGRHGRVVFSDINSSFAGTSRPDTASSPHG